MKKWLLGITCVLVAFGIIFYIRCGKIQQTSTMADQLEVRNNGTAIQWKYNDETDWNDLVALTELRGVTGENGKDGVDGKNGSNGKDGTNGKNGTNGKDGVDGKNGIDGKNGTNGKNGINGKDGVDGKTVEVQKSDLYIQWRYEGENWQNLVALIDITGPAGQNGSDGENGKTPEFRVNENILQWRYVGDEIWLNLYDLSVLHGLDGKDGQNGADGKDGRDGKDGNTPFIGENGNWWINTLDTGIKAEGTNGKDGMNGVDGSDGKQIEIQKTDLYVQWRYEGGEWQNLVALADITGPSGQNGTDGENGKTPEFRADGNQLQWRYTGDTTWLNLYDLSALKGADGKNGVNGTDGKNGKDGSCVGYFAANGKVYSFGAPLPFTVKKESGDLISYNSSGNKITLSKGHTYSLVFSGTVAVSAKGDDKTCGVSLIDGYNNSEMVLGTQTYVIIPKNSQSARLSMVYNTIYTAEEDITLTFQYTNMMFQYTNFNDSQYSIIITALD